MSASTNFGSEHHISRRLVTTHTDFGDYTISDSGYRITGHPTQTRGSAVDDSLRLWGTAFDAGHGVMHHDQTFGNFVGTYSSSSGTYTLSDAGNTASGSYHSNNSERQGSKLKVWGSYWGPGASGSFNQDESWSRRHNLVDNGTFSSTDTSHTSSGRAIDTVTDKSRQVRIDQGTDSTGVHYLNKNGVRQLLVQETTSDYQVTDGVRTANGPYSTTRQSDVWSSNKQWGPAPDGGTFVSQLTNSNFHRFEDFGQFHESPDGWSRRGQYSDREQHDTTNSQTETDTFFEPNLVGTISWNHTYSHSTYATDDGSYTKEPAFTLVYGTHSSGESETNSTSQIQIGLHTSGDKVGFFKWTTTVGVTVSTDDSGSYSRTPSGDSTNGTVTLSHTEFFKADAIETGVISGSGRTGTYDQSSNSYYATTLAVANDYHLVNAVLTTSDATLTRTKKDRTKSEANESGTFVDGNTSGSWNWHVETFREFQSTVSGSPSIGPNGYTENGTYKEPLVAWAKGNWDRTETTTYSSGTETVTYHTQSNRTQNDRNDGSYQTTGDQTAGTGSFSRSNTFSMTNTEDTTSNYAGSGPPAWTSSETEHTGCSASRNYSENGTYTFTRDASAAGGGTGGTPPGGGGTGTGAGSGGTGAGTEPPSSNGAGCATGDDPSQGDGGGSDLIGVQVNLTSGTWTKTETSTFTYTHTTHFCSDGTCSESDYDGSLPPTTATTTGATTKKPDPPPGIGHAGSISSGGSAAGQGADDAGDARPSGKDCPVGEACQIRNSAAIDALGVPTMATGDMGWYFNPNVSVATMFPIAEAFVYGGEMVMMMVPGPAGVRGNNILANIRRIRSGGAGAGREALMPLFGKGGAFNCFVADTLVVMAPPDGEAQQIQTAAAGSEDAEEEAAWRLRSGIVCAVITAVLARCYFYLKQEERRRQNARSTKPTSAIDAVFDENGWETLLGPDLDEFLDEPDHQGERTRVAAGQLELLDVSCGPGSD